MGGNKNEKNVIIKRAIPVQEGFHIIYLKDKEEARQAIYDEAKEAILVDLKRNMFGQIYNQLIEEIANERVTLEDDIKVEETQDNNIKKSNSKK